MAVNTISKVAGVTLSGSTNNQVATVTGGNSLTGESNLTFDGSTLTVTGDLSVAGNYTNSAQPAFLARRSSAASNVTGDNTSYTLALQVEEFDNGNDFDGTSTFTAPVAGKYFFTAGFQIEGLTSSHGTMSLTLATTSDTVGFFYGHPYNMSSGGVLHFAVRAIIDMAASDTAVAKIKVSGGSKVVDVNGSTNIISHFGGYLIA